MGLLARPTRLFPNTAAGLPQISDDGLTWTVRVKPGIYFTDDPAFRGKPRELVAQDYVYSFKRLLDPNLRPGGSLLLTQTLAGARGAVDAARKPGVRFDYDAPIEGVRASDRYTLQFRLTQPNYPVMEQNLTAALAVAREVVEAAGRDIGTRPALIDATHDHLCHDATMMHRRSATGMPGHDSSRCPAVRTRTCHPLSR